jgi:hypothetical protein
MPFVKALTISPNLIFLPFSFSYVPLVTSVQKAERERG